MATTPGAEPPADGKAGGGIADYLSPAKILVRLWDIDPQAARVLTIGLGAFAAAAIVISFKYNLATMALIALYVVGLSILVRIASELPKSLRYILGSALVITIIMVIALFFYSVVTDRPKPAYCLAKFWLRCSDVEEQLTNASARSIQAGTNVPAVILNPDKPVPDATPRPTATPSSSATPRPLPTPTPVAAPTTMLGDQTVYIQFAGLITRQSVENLNAALRRGGWQVASASGERTDVAAGLNEVRYSPSTDPAIAQALANAVTATKLTSAPVTVRKMAMIGPTTLELWISN